MPISIEKENSRRNFFNSKIWLIFKILFNLTEIISLLTISILILIEKISSSSLMKELNIIEILKENEN